MNADKKIFLILFRSIYKVLDDEIKDEAKRDFIFGKILDEFISEIKKQL